MESAGLGVILDSTTPEVGNQKTEVSPAAGVAPD